MWRRNVSTGLFNILLNIKFYPISAKCRPGAASYWNYSFHFSECPLAFVLCKFCHQRMYAETLCEHLIISNLLCCRQALPAIATGYRIRFAYVWSVSSNCYASSVGDYSGPKLICNNTFYLCSTFKNKLCNMPWEDKAGAGCSERQQKSFRPNSNKKR